MSKGKDSSTYRIEHDPKTKSFKIFTDKKDVRKKIIKFLLQKKLFVKDHREFIGQFLEIDSGGLKALLEEGKKEIKVFPKKEIFPLEEEIEKESELKILLEEKKYNLDFRIWEKEESGKTYYCCAVKGDIYSSPNLDGLISFLHGEYLVESNKPRTSLSINPANVFGVFEVARDVFSSDKSILRYNRNKGFIKGMWDGKKQFHPVIENIYHSRIIIDALDADDIIIDADDVANAISNTGFLKESVMLIQGLVILPLLLKFIYLGYEGLRDEAQEFHDEYRVANIKLANIEIKLEQFKRGLCQECNIEYDSIKDYEPKQFLKEIAKKLSEISDENVKNRIVNLAANYQKQTEEELDAPEIKDVLAAHCGWLAMVAMMSAIGAEEVQTIINIFGGAELPLLSIIGDSVSVAGQSLMAIYALHKMLDERKEWKEVEAELQKFRGAKDVSDLARQITDELLVAKRDNHKLQTFGNMALSSGQVMMAIGGPIGLGLNPLLYAGIAATLGGFAVNSVSELKYKTSYQINEDIDDLERNIITKIPNFTKDDFKNVGQALAKHAKDRILQLEILGHLRAPQLVLYQKFLKENEDEQGILSKAVGLLGGDKIARWLNKPPTASTDLVKDNELIAAHKGNKNDLDIFTVDEADLRHAVKRYEDLCKEGKNHPEVIKELQEEFIARKSADAGERRAKTVKELCASIIEKGGSSSLYLKKKLMRAVANGDLFYEGSLEKNVPEILKNGKKITVGQLNLNKFNEEDLAKFLSEKRLQKHSLSEKKKRSPLEEAHDKGLYIVKSDHLRPFAAISKLSSVATDFLDDNKQKNGEEKESSTRKDGGNDNEFPSSKSSENSRILEKDLLMEFRSLTEKGVSRNTSERIKQVKDQNEVINKVLEKSREFKLISQTEDLANNQTIFTYADPDHQDPNKEEYSSTLVTYVRNNSTGKIDVLYGEKTCALVIERPDMIKNGVITQINENKVEHYGKISDGIFQSFRRANSSKESPSSKPQNPESHSLVNNNPFALEQ